MNINTTNHIDVETGEGKTRTRLYVKETMYSIIAASGYPYPMFIVEWKYPKENPHRTKDVFEREVITLPDFNTLAWLDDYIQHQENKGCFINGILNIEDIKLPAYEIPQDYRDFACGEGERPKWYDSYYGE